MVNKKKKKKKKKKNRRRKFYGEADDKNDMRILSANYVILTNKYVNVLADMHNGSLRPKVHPTKTFFFVFPPHKRFIFVAKN